MESTPRAAPLAVSGVHRAVHRSVSELPQSRPNSARLACAILHPKVCVLETEKKGGRGGWTKRFERSGFLLSDIPSVLPCHSPHLLRLSAFAVLLLLLRVSKISELRMESSRAVYIVEERALKPRVV